MSCTTGKQQYASPQAAHKALQATLRKHRRIPRVWPAVDRTENNAFNLWHGPVSREQPLRWQA